MHVPAGCPHAFFNAEPMPARMLFMVSPSGHEDYLQELAERPAAGHRTRRRSRRCGPATTSTSSPRSAAIAQGVWPVNGMVACSYGAAVFLWGGRS
ncbi:hypothetical protein [Nonomuraea polychroma]|uniref:hypothetical protein n=1 Tax=Nonomuraea polychroma TaxID=46176 RepID=UPI000FDED552|nr:hypothetical protein [Nonomuraea polychroma]